MVWPSVRTSVFKIYTVKMIASISYVNLFLLFKSFGTVPDPSVTESFYASSHTEISLCCATDVIY